MTVRNATYPLRMPRSLKTAVEKLSAQDGTSMNQFVVMAVAEKVSALNTAEFFEQHRANADRKKFRKILNRRGGQSPGPKDQI